MWSLARKAFVYMIIASLAGSNSFAPKHAQAMNSGGQMAAVQHSHGGEGHAHRHSATLHNHENAQSSMSCHKDAVLTDRQGLPIVNCCVASCSAIALIFATFELPAALPVGIFVLWTSDSIVLAARTSDDPPPR
jgi:hypothetical protein